MDDLNQHINKPQVAEITLTPHRSLSAKGREIAASSVIMGGSVIAAAFFAAGVWPATIFIGATALGTGGAIHISGRAPHKNRDVLNISGENITVSKYRNGKPAGRFSLTSYFTKVTTENDMFDQCVKLALTNRGKTYTIGQFLPPDEKIKAAKTIKKALDLSRGPEHLFTGFKARFPAA